MVKKREALASFIAGAVAPFGNFRHSTRLRSATFDASNRGDRIRVMGNPTAYFEVIWTGETGEGMQNDSLDTEVLHGHQFRVNLWLAYKDHDTYELSSQKTFDDLCEGETGVLSLLRETPNLPVDDEMYMIYHPRAVVASEVSLDNEARELTHYLTFIISIR